MKPLYAFLLLSFVGVVQPSSGPHNLRVSPESADDGYVDLEVSWGAAKCGTPDPVYRLSLSRDGAPAEFAISTQNSSILLERNEFWSDYNITLETSPKCSKEKLTAKSPTGPGNPHRVRQFLITTSNATSFTFALQEAFMPKDVTGYEFALLREHANMTWKCVRVGKDVKDGWLNQTFPNVVAPGTHYILSVRPYLEDAGKTFYGESVPTEFSTDFFELPKPANIVEKLKFDGELAEIQISWEIGGMPENFRVAMVDASLLSDGAFKWRSPPNTQNTITINDLPHSTGFSLILDPTYTLRFANQDEYFRQQPTVYWFQTPMSGPRNLTWTKVQGGPRDDFAKVRLDWEAGTCGAKYPRYTIDVQRHGSDEKTSYETQKTSLTLENLEFFTDYEVTLKAGAPCPDVMELQRTFKVEGGAPHRVRSVQVKVQSRDITVTVEEAFMPKDVHTYSIWLYWTRIWSEPQKVFDIRRNDSNAKDGVFEVTLKNAVMANSMYDLAVSPLYKDGERESAGPSREIQFEAGRVEFPEPENIQFQLSDLERNKQSLDMTWEMKKSDYELIEYSVHLFGQSGSEEWKTTTKTPNCSVPDLRCRLAYDIYVIPIYNYSGIATKSQGASISVKTERCVPIKKYGYQTVSSSPTVRVHVGWEFPTYLLLSDVSVWVELCSPGCAPSLMDPRDESYSFSWSCNVPLKVIVSAFYDDKQTRETVLFDEKTRICPPSQPYALITEQEQNELHVEWHAPDSDGGSTVSYEVSLSPYGEGFGDNRITTTSLYASISFPEPPSRSSYVLSVVASTKNERGETLKADPEKKFLNYIWPQKPRNVTLAKRESEKLCFEVDSEGIYKYRVKTSDRRVITSELPEFCVKDLKPFQSIAIEVRACYLRTKDVCSEPFALEESTNVATPSKVVDLKAELKPDGTLLISWGRPEQPAGPIDGYRLNITVAQPSREEERLLPGSALSFRIFSPERNAEYEIAVWAFNNDRSIAGGGGRVESVAATYDLRISGDGTSLSPWTIFVIVIACLSLAAVIGGVVHLYRTKCGLPASRNEINTSHVEMQ